MTQENQSKLTFGKVYRQMRQARGFSINQLEDDHVSKSMISKFERGVSDLSATRLLHLISKLNITPSEFFSYHKDYQQSDLEVLVRQFYDAYFAKEVAQLLNLISRCQLLDQTNPGQTYFYLETMIWQGLDNLGYTELPLDFETNKKEVFDYLFSCEQWFYLEFHLFGNLTEKLSLNQLVQFSQPVLEKLDYYRKSPYNAVTDSILTTILYQACLENRPDIGKTYANIIARLDINELDFTSRIFFKFFLGCYYRYLTDEHSKGQALIDKAKEILFDLECHGRLDYLNQLEQDLYSSKIR
ncbi:Rgg family transcriptional regulator [Streptococcus caprae]|uniref:Helix-turn-helix domain-containing protein n=1 Tax=Streptococcus caprae TaxID=1640501 RepID=A0ABV8CY16_9STRE